MLRKLPVHKAEYVRNQLQELNELIRNNCEKYRVYYSEFWHAPFTQDLTTWSEDGIHPNSIGYVQLAPLVNEELMKKIKVK